MTFRLWRCLYLSKRKRKTCEGGSATKGLPAVSETNPLEVSGACGKNHSHVGEVWNQVVEQLPVGDLGDHVADECKLLVDAAHLNDNGSLTLQDVKKDTHSGSFVNPDVYSVSLLARS